MQSESMCPYGYLYGSKVGGGTPITPPIYASAVHTVQTVKRKKKNIFSTYFAAKHLPVDPRLKTKPNLQHPLDLSFQDGVCTLWVENYNYNSCSQNGGK